MPAWRSIISTVKLSRNQSVPDQSPTVHRAGPLRLPRLAIHILVLLVCIGSDQLTKWLAVRYLHSAEPLSFFHDTVRLSYVENSGGFLGLLGGLPENLRFLLLICGVAGLVIPGLIWIFWSTALRLSMAVSALLVFGGGLSNLVDRLVNDGRVIDFLNIGLGSFRTGIFNLADVGVLCGSFALGAMLFERRGGQSDGQNQAVGTGSRQ